MRIATSILGVCALLTGCASMLAEPEENNDDGLVRVTTSLIDELYVAPGVSLANYKRVMIEPIEVTFKDGWRKDHRELREQDFQALRTRLADMLHEKLVAEFVRGGYTIAEDPEPDVLRLRASIVDVDLAAPEPASDKNTLVHSAGEMTLRVLGFDAPSGALVARAKDYEQDPYSQRLERADRVTSNVAALKIFMRWAEELRSALDVARVAAGARQPQQ